MNKVKKSAEHGFVTIYVVKNKIRNYKYLDAGKLSIIENKNNLVNNEPG